LLLSRHLFLKIQIRKLRSISCNITKAVWGIPLASKIIVGDVCFIRRDGKVLLLLRKKEPLKGKWTGVGGKTEFDEEPFESCVREVKEETGLTIEPELTGILTSINVKENSKWILFVYTADKWKGDLKQGSEGMLEWVGEDKHYEKDLAFVGISLPYILNKKIRGLITGKIVHDGDKVLSCILREDKRILLKVPSQTS